MVGSHGALSESSYVHDLHRRPPRPQPKRVRVAARLDCHAPLGCAANLSAARASIAMLPLLLRSARFMRNAPAASFLARKSLAHSLSPRPSSLHTLAIANSSKQSCQRPPISMAMKMQQLCTSSKSSDGAPSEASSKPNTEAEQPAAAESEAGETAGESTATPADLEKQLAVMEEEMRMLKEDNQEKHDQLLRALADAENARRRAVVDVENANKFAVSKFAKDLLDVADNLGRAAESVPEAMRSSEEHKELSALYTGVELTEHVLLKTFEKYGARLTP
eukprot:6209257-Pleurochrysis_carterae.AAC.4